jgi:hypothetical protein
MRRLNAPLYGGLLLFSIVATVAGIIALWPASGASHPNVLGYRSLCTFTPAGPLFCFLAAGISCTVRASLVKRRAMYGKPVANRTAAVVLAIVLAVTLASTAWFVAVKQSYADANTAAMEEI